MQGDSNILARIDENVKHMREKLDDHQAAFQEHIKKDETIINEFVRPLWEKHQQDIGAVKTRGVGGVLVGYFINAGIAVAAAWAAVKGVR